MALIYLQHPTHGVKIANMEAEAIHDEEYGWVRYSPAAPAPAPAPKPELASADASVNGLAQRRRPRRQVEKED